MISETRPLEGEDLVVAIQQAREALAERRQERERASSVYAAALAAERAAASKVTALADVRDVERNGAFYRRPVLSDLEEAARRYPCDANGRLTPEAFDRARSVVHPSGDGAQMLGDQRVTTTDGYALFALRRHFAAGASGRRQAILTSDRW